MDRNFVFIPAASGCLVWVSGGTEGSFMRCLLMCSRAWPLSGALPGQTSLELELLSPGLGHCFYLAQAASPVRH